MEVLSRPLSCLLSESDDITSFPTGKASWRLVLPQRGQGLESARLHPGCGFLDLSSQALATLIPSWP